MYSLRRQAHGVFKSFQIRLNCCIFVMLFSFRWKNILQYFKSLQFDFKPLLYSRGKFYMIYCQISCGFFNECVGNIWKTNSYTIHKRNLTMMTYLLTYKKNFNFLLCWSFLIQQYAEITLNFVKKKKKYIFGGTSNKSFVDRQKSSYFLA